MQMVLEKCVHVWLGSYSCWGFKTSLQYTCTTPPPPHLHHHHPQYALSPLPVAGAKHNQSCSSSVPCIPPATCNSNRVCECDLVHYFVDNNNLCVESKLLESILFFAG
jgi:hypothetical protein